MLMGRKPAYMSGFRPINIPTARKGDKPAEPWTSLELPHVPGVSWRPQPARAATRRPGRNSDGRTISDSRSDRDEVASDQDHNEERDVEGEPADHGG